MLVVNVHQKEFPLRNLLNLTKALYSVYTVASLIDTNFINKGNIILLSRSGAKSQGNKPRWPGRPTAAIYIGD